MPRFRGGWAACGSAASPAILRSCVAGLASCNLKQFREIMVRMQIQPNLARIGVGYVFCWPMAGLQVGCHCQPYWKTVRLEDQNQNRTRKLGLSITDWIIVLPNLWFSLPMIHSSVACVLMWLLLLVPEPTFHSPGSEQQNLFLPSPHPILLFPSP
ncbi:hypothetical protein BDW62DRAFT_190859 [Aspergillus aurantiobrunneus]